MSRLTDFFRPIFGQIWPDEVRAIAQGPHIGRALNRVKASGHWLNAGCGEGLFVPQLRQAGIQRATHIDIQPPMDPSWRTSGDTILQGSLTELPFDDASFDGVICTEVLEHINDDQRALAEINRVLKPGGTLVISVPQPPAPPDDDHVREGYSRDALKTLAATIQLQDVTMRECLFLWSRIFMASWRWQRSSLGKGRRNFYPRFLGRMLGHLDRHLPTGRAWDLILTGKKPVS